MKKGFTLVELLAVMVVLAIIALISIPIVTTLINDSTVSTETISGQSYVKTVINTIMKQSLDNREYFEPSECIINDDGNVTCDGAELKIVADGEKPTGGFLQFEDGELIGARIEFEYTTVLLNAAGELVNLNDNIICARVTNQNVTTGNIPIGKLNPGDEYICEVNEKESYHFFVVSEERNKVNFILDRNIGKDGILDAKNATVAWISKTDYVNAGGSEATFKTNGYTDKGPITALNYVREATKNWTNISSLNETYTDEKDRYGTITLTGKARLPKFEELIGEGKCEFKVSGSCPLWLINYTAAHSNYPNKIVGNSGGYWAISSYDHDFAMRVHWEGAIAGSASSASNSYGVRPVISVNKKNIY